jgi:hypothetical protein
MVQSSFFRFHPLDRVFKDLPKGANSLLEVLSIHITALEIQRDRILQDVDALRSTSEPSHPETGDLYDRLLTDTNFYLIAWGDVKKTLQRLTRLVKNDARLNWIFQRRHKWFEQVRLARNSLEHMDKEIADHVTKTGGEPNILNLVHFAGYTNNIIVICGTRVDVSVSSFKRIDSLTTDLQKWLSKIPEKQMYRSQSSVGV